MKRRQTDQRTVFTRGNTLVKPADRQSRHGQAARRFRWWKGVAAVLIVVVDAMAASLV